MTYIKLDWHILIQLRIFIFELNFLRRSRSASSGTVTIENAQR
jgi:hypothetical protein